MMNHFWLALKSLYFSLNIALLSQVVNLRFSHACNPHITQRKFIKSWKHPLQSSSQVFLAIENDRTVIYHYLYGLKE